LWELSHITEQLQPISTITINQQLEICTVTINQQLEISTVMINNNHSIKAEWSTYSQSSVGNAAVIHRSVQLQQQITSIVGISNK
jgi:hypothetical protein